MRLVEFNRANDSDAVLTSADFLWTWSNGNDAFAQAQEQRRHIKERDERIWKVAGCIVLSAFGLLVLYALLQRFLPARLRLKS